jgi:Ni,Fe-hydrogenase III large subunit
VRAEEIQHSITLITRWLQISQDTGTRITELPRQRTPAGITSGVGITEGWRGTITHRVELATDGTLTRVKIVDPSFFNWPALPLALADTIVPDFPLTNKSFNLSYAGNDL